MWQKRRFCFRVHGHQRRTLINWDGGRIQNKNSAGSCVQMIGSSKEAEENQTGEREHQRQSLNHCEHIPYSLDTY